MNTYAKGRRFEYKVRDYLENKDWLVIRCSSSKPVDLIAIKDGKVIIIECKYNGVLSNYDKEKLNNIKKKTKCSIYIASYKNKKFRIYEFKE